MRRTSFAAEPCPIARSLELVGDWWTLLILRDAIFFDVSRFEEFRRKLDIPTNVLSARLAALVEHGILERRDAPQGRSPHAYAVTTKGRELWPVIVSLAQWGHRWAGPSDELWDITWTHAECGAQLPAGRTCTGCGQKLEFADIVMSAAPPVNPPPPRA
jgi:DNA-binding HxlR family transcriptional regulator